MTSKPPPMVIRLIERNSVDPGLQATVPSERADVAEHLEKHLLHYIGRFGSVVHQSVNQVVYGLLISFNQLFVRLWVSSAKRFDQTLVFTRDVRGAASRRCFKFET